MRSIRPFSTARSPPSAPVVRPPSAAAPRLRPPPCASQQRKRPEPRPGRAARSPLRLHSTRRPRGPISPRPQRLPSQRPGRLQTGPAARSPRPRRNTSQPPGHPSRRPQRSPRRQRRGHPRIGSKGAGWRPATGPTRGCRLIPPLARLFNPGPRQGRHLLRMGIIPRATTKPPRCTRQPNPIRANRVHLLRRGRARTLTPGRGSSHQNSLLRARPRTLSGPWSSRLSVAWSSFCKVSLAFL